MQHAEQLTAGPDAQAAWQTVAWPADASTASSSHEPASGRVDGSFSSLQSGQGNLPLHLKLELAYHLGSFEP